MGKRKADDVGSIGTAPKTPKAEDRAVAAELKRVEKAGAAIFDEMEHVEIDADGMERIGQARAELVAAQQNETAAKEAHQRAKSVRDQKQDGLNEVLAEYFPIEEKIDDPDQMDLGGALPDELPGNLGRRSLEEIPFLEGTAVVALEATGLNSVQALHSKIVGQPGDWWKPVKGVGDRRATKLVNQFKAWLWKELRKSA